MSFKWPEIMTDFFFPKLFVHVAAIQQTRSVNILSILWNEGVYGDISDVIGAYTREK